MYVNIYGMKIQFDVILNSKISEVGNSLKYMPKDAT